MDKIKILVACHKPGLVCHDDVYIPIHVGRAVSKIKEEMAGMIGDDTGDNISDKNPKYCELTAQYWAWKNLHDVEYVGFCHYRRYFNFEKGIADVNIILGRNDAVVLELVLHYPVWREITQFVSLEDYTIMLKVLKKKYPEYEDTIVNYLNGYVFYPKNMLICRKELFDKYAEWLFDILFECEKLIKPSPYTRQRRSLAYLGEYLLSIFFMHNKYSLKHVSYCDYPGHKCVESKHRILKRYVLPYLQIVDKRNRRKSIDEFCLSEVMTGFANDGIIL